MRRFLWTVLYTLVALAAWTGILVTGTFDGWWQTRLAPKGDTRAFMDAAIKEIDETRRGNAAFVLIEDGKVFGEHFTSAGQRVDRDSLFQVATMSQWITAWGVMTLVESGKLALDTPVSTYLTRWQLPSSKFDNNGVTVRRLLSHSAGLTDGLGYRGFKRGEPVQPLVASLTRAADADDPGEGSVLVGLEPGKEMRQSGGGFTLLQLIVEEVSGQSFSDYMTSAVFVPLGMTRSLYSVDVPTVANVAEYFDADGKPAIPNRFTSFAAASFYTSAADMTRFLQAHVAGPNGEPAGRGVLKPQTLEEMRRQHASFLKYVVVGLGTELHASNNAGGWIIGHDSYRDSINSAARLDPKTRNGILIFETGNDVMASTVAGKWVYWQTGNQDLPTLALGIRDMLKVLAAGWIAIPVMAAVLGWGLSRLTPAS